MRKVVLLAEDICHRDFLEALILRMAVREGIEVRVIPLSTQGGYGKAISETKRYVRDIDRGVCSPPDLLVVATDSNCKGRTERSNALAAATTGCVCPILHAIPDPHIERWLLQDSTAFKRVFGKGCSAPDHKCERGRYKSLLLEAVRDAGIWPPLGGVEYAGDLAREMDLDAIRDDSLRRFVDDIRRVFRQWAEA